ncbi:MAG: PAS domain S-box protein [Syntrophales bacterium]
MKPSKSIKRSPSKTIADGETAAAEFLQKLLDSIPIPIFYKDIHGAYLGGNREFARFLGRSMQEIVGRKVREIAPADLAEIYERADAQLLRRGGAQTYESAIMHADGTRHIVVLNKAALTNRDGRPCGLIGSIFDITLRKQFEAQVLSSEERYRRIFDSIQDIYYEVGLDGTILEISPSIEKYFPLRREDLIGRSIDEFYVDRDNRNHFLRQIKKKGKVHDFEVELRDRRGALSTCSITAAILPGDRSLPPRIVGSLRDISERKRNEETLRQSEEELSIKSRNLEEVNTALKVLLRQREDDRTELADNVLTNMKMSILPQLEKLREGPLTQEQRKLLEIVEAQAKKVISPFLNRLSQSCFDLTPREIRVADFVKNGYTTKEISSLLGVSLKTVDYHRDNIRRKLGLKQQHANLRSFLLRLS